MKHAILLTHGPIGDAMIEAARGITGLDDGLYPISVNQMSAAEIGMRLLSIINGPEERTNGVLILASLKGGSCWNVAVSVARDQQRVRVLSGLNLAMVLSFLTKRDQLELDELAEQVTRDGLRGIDCWSVEGK